ncbi:hypothetical protein B296_00050178 [Ensete ventricosum]|uniref:Uncharacterized protein n=1 Tax=Ensete ventricosum TaxID=4639 RepID=A0A426X0S1_ENSVE|nr:hypothetical protein B296_00050178 [Ensete ventricosum]
MKWCQSSLTGFFNFILRVPGISWRQNQALFHSNCYPGSLDADKAAGKIIVCVDTDPTVTRRTKKTAAEGAGAKGLILADEAERGVPFNSGSFPFSEVANDVGAQILKYINSTNCPHNASPDLISNVNYPSISIAKLGGKQTARTASYQVTFDAKAASKGYGYGSITWSDGAHSVRTVFAVNVM